MPAKAGIQCFWFHESPWVPAFAGMTETGYSQFLRETGGWLAEGHVHYREDLVPRLESAPRALIGLLRGENFGKVVVKL